MKNIEGGRPSDKSDIKKEQPKTIPDGIVQGTVIPLGIPISADHGRYLGEMMRGTFAKPNSSGVSGKSEGSLSRPKNDIGQESPKSERDEKVTGARKIRDYLKRLQAMAKVRNEQNVRSPKYFPPSFRNEEANTSSVTLGGEDILANYKPVVLLGKDGNPVTIDLSAMDQTTTVDGSVGSGKAITVFDLMGDIVVIDPKSPAASGSEDVTVVLPAVGPKVTPLNITEPLPQPVAPEPAPVAKPRVVRTRRLTLEEARDLVEENASVADISQVRGDALDMVTDDTGMVPADLVMANRSLRLAQPEFARFFGECLDNPAIRDLVFNPSFLGVNDGGDVNLDAGKGAPVLPPLEPFAINFGQEEHTSILENDGIKLEPVFSGGQDPATIEGFSKRYDTIVPVLKEVFKDEALLREWMKSIDAVVARSSQENLDAIDEASKEGEQVKKNVVLVGGGPLTSLSASVLSPFFDVTVITEQSSVGQPWRYRPLHINSSTEVSAYDGLRLPLLDGSTTPVSVSEQLNNLDTDVLLGVDTLKIECDDSSIREYVSGMRLGKLVATEIALNATDYIVGQTVDPQQVVDNPDGSETKLITLTDGNGNERTIVADDIFFITGPGKEVSKLKGFSEADYNRATKELDNRLAKARRKLAKAAGALRKYEGALSIDPQNRNVKLCIKKNEEILKTTSIDLPRILTLTALEKIYEFWDRDLDRDPERFPLAPLFDSGVNIAEIGDGDTARVIKALLDGKAPKEAYPEGFDIKEIKPNVTMFGVEQTTPQQYDEENRPRYEGTVTADTRVITDKANACLWLPDDVAVDVFYGGGFADAFDYAFVATGVERGAIAEKLGIGGQKIRDAEDYAVGLGDKGKYVTGSATGFKLKDFPFEIQEIISVLGIPENTISAWVHGLLTERMMWTYLRTKGANKEKVAQLAKIA